MAKLPKIPPAQRVKWLQWDLLHKDSARSVDVGELARYDRPTPRMAEYDLLLSAPCVGTA